MMQRAGARDLATRRSKFLASSRKIHELRQLEEDEAIEPHRNVEGLHCEAYLQHGQCGEVYRQVADVCRRP